MIEKELSKSIKDCIEKEYALKGIFEPYEISLKITSMVIEYFNTTHSKALACHCECLGMNAENSISVCNDTKPPFRNNNYVFTLHKWGLTNEKGEPTI